MTQARGNDQLRLEDGHCGRGWTIPGLKIIKRKSRPALTNVYCLRPTASCRCLLPAASATASPHDAKFRAAILRPRGFAVGVAGRHFGAEAHGLELGRVRAVREKILPHR